MSDEAATYRPEMQWLAEQLQRLGRRVFCMRPEDVFPLGGEMFFDVEGTPEAVAKVADSHTGRYLAQMLKARRVAAE